MFLFGSRRWLRLAFGRPVPRPRCRRTQARLEPLELRWVPAISSTIAFALTAIKGAAFAGHTVATFTTHVNSLAKGTPPEVIRGTGADFNVTEEFQFSGTVATFTDTNPNASPANLRARIHWADGTTTNGTVSGNTGGPFTVSGTHTYLDEGDYSTRITLLPNAPSTAVGTAKGDADVEEGDALTKGSTSPIVATAGSEFSGDLALFISTGISASRTPAGDFKTLIIWGDGTRTWGHASGGGGLLTVNGQHTWATSGTFLIRIVIEDDGAGGGAAIDATQTTATVKPAPTRMTHDH